MPVRVTSTVRPLAPRLAPDETLMQEVGLLAIRRIRSRTMAGKDADGGALAPLSAGYVKQRLKAGVGATSNLTLSGAMLNAMAVVHRTGRMVRIAFATGSGRGASRGTLIQRSRSTGAELKARMHMGEGRVLRRFFDLNDEDDRAIVTVVREWLAKRMQG